MVQPFLDGYFLGGVRSSVLSQLLPSVLVLSPFALKKYIFLTTGLWSWKTGQLKAFSSWTSSSRKRADECTWVSYFVWQPPEKDHKFSLDCHVVSSWLCISVCVWLSWTHLTFMLLFWWTATYVLILTSLLLHLWEDGLSYLKLLTDEFCFFIKSSIWIGE